MTGAAEPTRIANAERVVRAEVADVYSLVASVDRWPQWMNGVIAKVTTPADEVFELSSVEDGTTRTHQLVVHARGPVHSFVAEVDGRWVVDFRTSPHQSGTVVRVTADRRGKPVWRDRLGARRVSAICAARLETVLEGLAAHIEPAPE